MQLYKIAENLLPRTLCWGLFLCRSPTVTCVGAVSAAQMQSRKSPPTPSHPASVPTACHCVSLSACHFLVFPWALNIKVYFAFIKFVADRSFVLTLVISHREFGVNSFKLQHWILNSGRYTSQVYTSALSLSYSPSSWLNFLHFDFETWTLVYFIPHFMLCPSVSPVSLLLNSELRNLLTMEWIHTPPFGRQDAITFAHG